MTHFCNVDLTKSLFLITELFHIKALNDLSSACFTEVCPASPTAQIFVMFALHKDQFKDPHILHYSYTPADVICCVFEDFCPPAW